MARTTSAAVKAIMHLDYDSVRQPSLEPFIETASSLVDDLVECAAESDVVLSAAKLELIERWLAAHCYKQSSDQQHQSSSNKSSASYKGQSGMGFDATTYGQMAVRLDTSGCLENADKGGDASLDWLGLPPSEQTDYVDRD